METAIDAVLWERFGFLLRSLGHERLKEAVVLALKILSQREKIKHRKNEIRRQTGK
jgi:hypothetical protein